MRIAPLAPISTRLLLATTLLAWSACSSSGGGGTGGTGGSQSGTGGTSATGGSNATGGTSATGGNAATGGQTGTGGGTGTGGISGSGGTPATGGQPGTGGHAGTSGAAGSGGGSGGAAGHTGTGGSATGGTAGGGAALFSDDFESDTAGSQPAGWDNFIAYNYKTTNPMGALSALTDSTRAHGGTKSVHFKSDGNMVFLERALPSGTNHLFVRAYIYMTSSIGMGPSSNNHETLLGLAASPSGADNQVRFGQIKGAVGTNEVPSDDIAPPMAKWNGPPVISAATWHCIEVEFNGVAAYNTLNAWSDGTLVHSITQNADWAHGGLPATWLSGKFNTVLFGWQSFSSMANEIWMDDLVLSTTRVGCN